MHCYIIFKIFGFPTISIIERLQFEMYSVNINYESSNERAFSLMYYATKKSRYPPQPFIKAPFTLRSQIEGYTRLLIFRKFSNLPAVI